MKMSLKIYVPPTVAQVLQARQGLGLESEHAQREVPDARALFDRALCGKVPRIEMAKQLIQAGCVAAGFDPFGIGRFAPCQAEIERNRPAAKPVPSMLLGQGELAV